MIKLTKDTWLSDIMARPVHRVTVEGEAGHALENPHGFYFARIATPDINMANALAAIGFRVVDTGLTLERATAGEGDGQDVRTRIVVPADRDAVTAIARTGFKYSRFHLDPAIPPSLANEIKAQWARNFFRGLRGDEMIVAEADNQVAGFLQILYAGDAVVIDLIAVGAAWRGKGLGAAMIERAAARAPQPCMRVGTQAANVDSLRFYESLGFRTVFSSYVMHLHA